MTTRQGQRRGQPLWALGGVLIGWITMRAAMFDGFPAELVPQVQAPRAERVLPLVGNVHARSAPQSPSVLRVFDPALPRPAIRAAPDRILSTAPPPAMPARPVGEGMRPRPPVEGAPVVVGHNLLWMAAMRAIPLTPELGAAVERMRPRDAPRPPRGAAVAGRLPRWSGDGWLAWRGGAAGLLSGGGAAPSYGGSQGGAVLRYALAPGSPVQPTAYVRAVRALATEREGDVAAGLSLRPAERVPVAVHVEARLARRGERLEARPAAFVSGGIDELPLAGGLTARGYAQAGYVAGRDATGFADGNLIAERALWREDDTRLAAGAGVWGGAQRGAARLDLGPTASLRLRVGTGTARISADYRLRIAGNAAPAAGAAVTLATGF